MKKIVALVMIGAFAVSMLACSAKKTEESTDTPADTTGMAPVDTSASPAPVDTAK